MGGGDGEAGEEALGVGGSGLVCWHWVRAAGCGCTAQDAFTDDVDELVEVAETSF